MHYLLLDKPIIRQLWVNLFIYTLCLILIVVSIFIVLPILHMFITNKKQGIIRRHVQIASNRNIDRVSSF